MELKIKTELYGWQRWRGEQALVCGHIRLSTGPLHLPRVRPHRSIYLCGENLILKELRPARIPVSQRMNEASSQEGYFCFSQRNCNVNSRAHGTFSFVQTADDPLDWPAAARPSQRGPRAAWHGDRGPSAPSPLPPSGTPIM